MPDAGAASGWRITLFTDMPQIVSYYSQYLDGAGHTIVGIVTSRKRNPGVAGVVSNAPATADVIVSDRPRRWARMLAPLRQDLIISTVFPWRIPQDVLDLPRLGAINLHPSLLPRYRGTMTPNWTLLNGEQSSGISVHRTVAEFDAGPILAQVAVDVADDDDLTSYMQRLFSHAPAVLNTALARIAAGDPGDPQDETQATYFGALPDDQRVIDWSSPSRRIHNQIRGFGAFLFPPGAFGTIEGVPARILRSQLVSEPDPVDGIEPGTVLARDDKGLTIQCGDGPIRVLAWEPA